MRLTVNKNWCKLCGICESVCRSNAIRITHDRIEFDEEQCVLCRACIYQCPDMAISIERVAEKD